MDVDLTKPEEAAGEHAQAGANAGRKLVRAMPITEVREDLLICEWATHYQEVERGKVHGAEAAQPGNKVEVFADGSMALAGSQPASGERTKVFSAPEPEAETD